VPADPGEWRVEELSPGHDRSAFSCAHAALDEFLKRYAGQNQKTGVSRTFVAASPRGNAVAAYYTLSAGSVSLEKLTPEQSKHLPRYPVPVALLGRLAVDLGSRGQGLGEFMLMDALRRVEIADRSIDIHAIEVVAIDSAAKRFYLKYGFTELRDDPHHLYLSMKAVRALKL
jgi:GNAT superfamily N-acetyltransferase